MKNFIMLSAELERLSTREKAERTNAMRETLNGWARFFDNRSVTDAIGCYFGSEESSFKWEGGAEDLNMLKALAFAEYGQESILFAEFVRGRPLAYLHYRSGRKEYVGVWTEVSKRRALSQDCYTVIKGKYYITIK